MSQGGAGFKLVANLAFLHVTLTVHLPIVYYKRLVTVTNHIFKPASGAVTERAAHFLLYLIDSQDIIYSSIGFQFLTSSIMIIERQDCVWLKK